MSYHYPHNADASIALQEVADEDIRNAFLLQKAAFDAAPCPGAKTRQAALRRLGEMLDRFEDRFTQAISQDFGHRSAFETRMAEFVPVRAAIGHAIGHVKGWMKHRRVGTDFLFWPGYGRIVPQPVGVVGIISPWNYPLQLALAPLVGALAAGNRAILKPSEFTPAFSEVLKEAIADTFAPDEVIVFTGGIKVSSAVSALPLGHLVFTGSTSVGRIVAGAAAKNLTPVTLELGGKSPVIIDDSADLDHAARRLVKGKLLNAGQTCIAPDYALVPRGQLDAFRQKVLEAARKMYPHWSGNADATSIVTGRHFDRLAGLVESAVAKGASVETPYGAFDRSACTDDRMMPFCVLSDVQDDMDVMQEEIFGPILPVVAYDDLSQAISYIRARPNPLALYWFGKDKANKAWVVAETSAGGVTINDTLLHVVQENLPFGGAGPSGIGAYHGIHGFDGMSHLKAVYTQPKSSGTDMLIPPSSKIAGALLALTEWRWRKKG